MKYLIILSLFIAGCAAERKEKREVIKSPYELTCEDVGGSLKRCENNEVICYSSEAVMSVITPDCKFK